MSKPRDDDLKIVSRDNDLEVSRYHIQNLSADSVSKISCRNLILYKSILIDVDVCFLLGFTSDSLHVHKL